MTKQLVIIAAFVSLSKTFSFLIFHLCVSIFSAHHLMEVVLHKQTMLHGTIMKLLYFLYSHQDKPF